MACGVPTVLAAIPPTAAPRAWPPMSTPTAMPMAEARVSRLSRMPITVLVGIDTANIPPAIGEGDEGERTAGLEPEQRRGGGRR